MIYKNELDKVARYLVRNHHTVAIAESVTSGLIQNVFSNIFNASQFFEGGITAYNLQQKCTHLFIDPVHAVTCNCVSERVAEEMAVGISKSFKTNWGIAITGYAAPIPEQGLEELYACYAFSFNKKIIRRTTLGAIKEDPEQVQHFYMLAVLEDFIQCCTEMEKV